VLPYNLSIISQIAAEVAIERYDACIQPLVDMIVNERDRLFLRMNSIPGLTPIRSRANFMVVRSVIQPRRVFEELLRREILIRDISGYPKLKDYFRVSVGKPEENQLLLSALGEICKCEVANQ
jgi:histidinol-phosphate aminotransferase